MIYNEVQEKLKAGQSEEEAFEGVDPGSCTRLVVDYRKLNSEIEPIQGYFPTTAEILSFLQHKNVFSGIDLKHFYRSLRWSKGAKEKTTFIVGRKMYQSDFTLEGVGLLPVYANSISQSILKRSSEFTRVYLDDFTVATVTREQHRQAVELLFQDLADVEALVSVPKLVLATDQIKILGFTVKTNGKGLVTYEPVTQMRKIFENLPLPSNTKELYSAIGCLNFVQAFLSNYQIILSPLNRLLAQRVQSRTKEPINWTEHNTEKRAFNILMSKMARVKPLAVLTDQVPIRITTDASHYGFGAVLELFINDDWQIAQFYSKKFDPSVVRATSVINKELLAIILTLERFKQFIVSCSDVQVRTDARSLVFLYYSGNVGSDSKACRWLSKIREMNVKFLHFLPREENQTADFLSNRFNCPSPVHNHLAKYSFAKATKKQVNIEIKPGQTFTNQDFEDLVTTQPDIIIEKSPEPSSEIFDPDVNLPCADCEKEGYSIQIENEVSTLSSQSLPPSINWLDSMPVVRETLQREIELLDQETGCIQSITPDTRFTAPFAHYTAAHIQQIQRSDKECVNLITMLTDKTKTPPSAKRFTLINGCLLARIKDKRRLCDRTNLALVLPRPAITELVGSCHVINHFGAKKLVQLVQKNFYNKDLKTIARAIALGCKVCMLYKNRTNRENTPGQLKIAKYPMQIVYLDVMYMSDCYHLGRTYKYILNFIDSFSSYVFSYPLQTQKANEILRIFEQLVPHISVSEFVSDNGSTLLPHKQIHDFLSSFNIQARLVLPYCSKSNGLVENFNRQMRNALILTSKSLNQTWVESLPHVVQSFNLCPLQGKRFADFSPYQLVNRGLPQNSDPLGFLNVLEPKKYDAALTKHTEALKTFKQIRYDQMSKQLAESIKESKLKVGNFVYLLDIDRDKQKHPKEKPFLLKDRVYKIIYRNGFMLRLENIKDNKETIRCHIDKVRLINERSPEVFQELSKKLQQILGKPLTQKQLRRMNRKNKFPSHILPEPAKREAESSGSPVSSRPSTKIDTQEKHIEIEDTPSIEKYDVEKYRNFQAEIPDLTPTNYSKTDKEQEVQIWLDNSVRPKDTNPKPIPRLTRSELKADKTQKPQGSTTSLKNKSITNSALKRLRETFRNMVSKPTQPLQPEPAHTSIMATTPTLTNKTPPNTRRSKRIKQPINYKLFANKGRKA